MNNEYVKAINFIEYKQSVTYVNDSVNRPYLIFQDCQRGAAPPPSKQTTYRQTCTDQRIFPPKMCANVWILCSIIHSINFMNLRGIKGITIVI